MRATYWIYLCSLPLWLIVFARPANGCTALNAPSKIEELKHKTAIFTPPSQSTAQTPTNAAPPNRFPHAADLICGQPPGYRVDPTQVFSAFAGEGVLNLVINDPGHVMSQTSMEELRNEIELALLLWHRRCAGCIVPGNASAFLIAGRIYIDRVLANILPTIDYDHVWPASKTARAVHRSKYSLDLHAFDRYEPQ